MQMRMIHNSIVGGSDLFKCLVDDYFVTKVNCYNTRGNSILDLLFRGKSENIDLDLAVREPHILNFKFNNFIG